MKRLVALVFAIVCLAACQKAPFLTMTGSRSYSFTRDGGSQTFAFSCNRDWRVSSSESWIRISPSSGSASDGDISVTVTCAPNTTYDPRTATITVTVEELTETISISQATGLGLIVSPTSYDLTNAEQTIEVEVQQNVNYTIEIDDACKDWIKKGGTKALSTDNVTFNISANTSYDNREGRITFKQTDGDLVQTVTVRQSQTNGLFITTPDYNLSNETHTLSVEVKANVEFEVASQADWIKYVETKALTPSTIVLSIDANKSYDNRKGTVLVKQKNGDLTGVITISQRQTDYLSVEPRSFEVSNEGQSISIEVKDNIRYRVVIPDDAKGWISVQSNTQTKALTDDKVVLSIAKNLSYDPRRAFVTIKQTDGPLAETVEIKQAQGDGLFVTTPEYNLSNEAHTLSVELKANVEFEVVSEVSWIDYVETKALSTSTVMLSISANEDYDSRTGKVKIKQKNGSLEGIVTIKQEQTDGLFLTHNNIDLTNEEQIVEIGIKNNVSYSVVIPEDAKNWISVQSNTQTKALVDNKVILAIAKNEEFDDREASITIKQTDGSLAETVNISQAKLRYLATTPSTISCSFEWDGGCFNFEIDSNVDFSIDNPEWITINSLSESILDNGLTKYSYSVTLAINKGDKRQGGIIIGWDDGNNYQQKTILVEQNYLIKEIANNEAGMLYKSIDSDYIDCIHELHLTGDLNGTDFLIIRRMKQLTVLDMKGARIVEGGSPYYTDYREFRTSNNEIGDITFFAMGSLSTVVLPEGIISIGGSAFMQCFNLQSINLPSSLKRLGDGCFSDCERLKSIIIPESVEEIGYDAFSNCYVLETINIPEKIRIIESFAFHQTGIKTITIPKNVEEIRSSSFSYCRQLKEVHIKSMPSTLMRIDEGAFYEPTYENATLYIPKGTKDGYMLTTLGKFKNIVEE